MEERPAITRCLASAVATLAIAAALVIAVMLAATLIWSKVDESDPTPSSGSRPLKVVAVGDAFVSGEGARAFFAGTDAAGSNECRRASTAFPYLLADFLDLPSGHDGVELTSLACSGAATTNVVGFDDIACTDRLFPDGCPQPQYQRAPRGEAEGVFQVDNIPADADLMLVGIGATDAQLTDAVALCMRTTASCRSRIALWVAALDETLAWRLERVYTGIRIAAPNAQIAAITYPNLLFADVCGSTRLDQDETDFFIASFLPHLNDTIRRAAAAARVDLIDTTDALAGHRLCQPAGADGTRPEIGAAAVQMKPHRGITWKLSSWFHGSFQADEFGHQLIAARVAREINVLFGDHNARPKPPGELADPPDTGFATGPPNTVRYENDSPCGTRLVEHRTTARPLPARLTLTDADPQSTVCYRPLDGRWLSIPADGGAPVEVPLQAHDRDGLGGWHEILFRSDGTWNRLVIVAPAGPDTATVHFALEWAWPWATALTGVLIHPVILATLLAFAAWRWIVWCRRTDSRPDRLKMPRGISLRGSRGR